MGNVEQALLDNHLSFLASHRGVVRHEGVITFIESDRPEFTYAILGHGSKLKNLPTTVQSVQLLPWSEISTDKLSNAGFSPTFGLSYMVLSDAVPEWRFNPDLTVERAVSEPQMDIFSEVQSRGFNETPESFDRWHHWLKAANHRNLDNPKQHFYIGRIGRDPVGTVLTVVEGQTAGIYAVATLGSHRKKGISTTIMSKAVSDLKAKGIGVITLQVKQDSYVEDFYRHLGFKRIFTTGMFRRNV